MQKQKCWDWTDKLDEQQRDILLFLNLITEHYASTWLIFFHFTMQVETNDLRAI